MPDKARYVRNHYLALCDQRYQINKPKKAYYSSSRSSAPPSLRFSSLCYGDRYTIATQTVNSCSRCVCCIIRTDRNASRHSIHDRQLFLLDRCCHGKREHNNFQIQCNIGHKIAELSNLQFQNSQNLFISKHDNLAI